MYSWCLINKYTSTLEKGLGYFNHSLVTSVAFLLCAWHAWECLQKCNWEASIFSISCQATRFSHKILPQDSPRGSELSEQGRNWNAVVSNGVLRQQSLQKVHCNSQCCRLACPLVEWVYETVQICHAVLTATNNLVDFLLYPHTNILACAQMMGDV